jgi:AcrR family transcriptional regulator
MARQAATKSARRARADLTEETIAAAALEIIEEVGLAGLSMRVLGERLGTSHMAVYHHVADKRALQELAADAVLERVELPGPEVGDWVERLVQHARSFWLEVVPYPGLGAFLVNEHHVSGAARRLYEYTIATLLDAGFSPRDAALGREALFALSPYYFTHPSSQRPVVHQGSRWEPKVKRALESGAKVSDLDRWTFAKRTLLEGLRARLDASSGRTTASSRRRRHDADDSP